MWEAQRAYLQPFETLSRAPIIRLDERQARTWRLCPTDRIRRSWASYTYGNGMTSAEGGSRVGRISRQHALVACPVLLVVLVLALIGASHLGPRRTSAHAVAEAHGPVAASSHRRARYHP